MEKKERRERREVKAEPAHIMATPPTAEKEMVYDPISNRMVEKSSRMETALKRLGSSPVARFAQNMHELHPVEHPPSPRKETANRCNVQDKYHWGPPGIVERTHTQACSTRVAGEDGVWQQRVMDEAVRIDAAPGTDTMTTAETESTPQVAVNTEIQTEQPAESPTVSPQAELDSSPLQPGSQPLPQPGASEPTSPTHLPGAPTERLLPEVKIPSAEAYDPLVDEHVRAYEREAATAEDSQRLTASPTPLQPDPTPAEPSFLAMKSSVEGFDANVSQDLRAFRRRMEAGEVFSRLAKANVKGASTPSLVALPEQAWKPSPPTVAPPTLAREIPTLTPTEANNAREAVVQADPVKDVAKAASPTPAAEQAMYSILALSPGHASATITQITNPVPADETTLPLTMALRQLALPAAFISHLSQLSGEGFEPVHASGDILILRQRSAEVRKADAPRPVNPIDKTGDGEWDLRVPTGDYMSPTGFVRWDRFAEEKEARVEAPKARGRVEERTPGSGWLGRVWVVLRNTAAVFGTAVAGVYVAGVSSEVRGEAGKRN
ncbi:hypothetical protein EJ06DRAFT_526901 [Trichodelitschia bisporula]|uniref:Uncharacterized protein n=1 Tax=Trichodelitschia bisporula TaxID=703511 RepID=A0A6G1I5A5_9PEZI|nr:hypothetical protein EJ06DRAFT_526901 [Trichodelitschia bisporula]